MRKNKKINRLFNRINQEFFIGKTHLMSCESIEQVQSASNWMADINNNWDNLIDIACEDLSMSDYRDATSHYTKLNEAMAEERKELCEEKVGELMPPQPQEPKYPKVVKIKGFC